MGCLMGQSMEWEVLKNFNRSFPGSLTGTDGKFKWESVRTKKLAGGLFLSLPSKVVHLSEVGKSRLLCQYCATNGQSGWILDGLFNWKFQGIFNGMYKWMFNEMINRMGSFTKGEYGEGR